MESEPVSLPLGFLRSITDDFCTERELGKGAYGVVYKGILPCGSVIAIKKFNGGILAGDDRSFKNEASSLMDIKHQNVIQLLGFCTESMGAMMMKQPDGKVIIVEEETKMLCFEYMCNGDLYNYLSDESSGLDWNTRYKIIKGICSGLKYLHGRNTIHMDLKPQNILMDTTMMPKIADFGLSKLLGAQKSHTVAVTPNRPGTRGYMAPEYIDRGIISTKADIFSLGVIIIEILTGSKDDYPYYHQSNEVFQEFTEKVLTNWRKRFERSSKYTAPELRIQLVKQCIDIALECVHPGMEKRPNVSNIIEILNAAEGRCYVEICQDLTVYHQMGTREGLPTSGVLREDGLVAPIKIALKNHAQAWITKVMMTPVVAPLQPQRGPVLGSVDGSLAALCYQGARNASFWVVHKTLASLEDNMLKNWAATINLDSGVEALERELKYVKVFLESTLGKVIHNVALEEILMVLRDLVYDAEDVLDEMEYFRIHASLHGEVCSHYVMEYFCIHASLNAEGCPYKCNTEYMLDKMGYFRIQDILGLNIQFPWSSMPSVCVEQTKSKYRENASKRIQLTVEKMQLMHKRIYDITTPLGSNWSTIPNIAQSRPITTSQSIEPRLYGRKLMMDGILHDITKGKYSSEVLTVIPIVGPGGIGKTTLAQHIYHSGQVQEHFDVKDWRCVSLNFNVNKLMEEIKTHIIPKDDLERCNGTASELIGERLKNKRFLLVLDDIWDCSDGDEWKQLLVPFKRSQVQGNIIIVTTRFPAQAQIMVQKYNQSINLQGIEDEEFKELFLEIVFGHYDQSRKEHSSLIETGFKIVKKLKGSPLAAKTVGRLLKTQLDLVHWTRILESKEWDHCSGKNDIMVALKLSFDYLPSKLQHCFSYCALFPQDYKFKREELIHFWIGLEVLHSSHAENRRVEDIGQSHLIELVNYGFLEEKEGGHGRTCYIIHDLLYELAQKVSSLECLSIDSSQSKVNSQKVIPSIRHLSINIDHTNVKDRFTLQNYVEDLTTLGTRLNVKKLRTLMIFGEHHGCFLKAFGDLFREAKALRLVFLKGASYDVEDLLYNFYDLIHLRYLRIESYFTYQVRFLDHCKFTKFISRFYHMMVLDVVHCGNIIDLPQDMSNLVKLRHFLVANGETHSSIVNVGNLKSLQELRRFVVKRKEQGFELREIGQLVDLRGSLGIYDLEKVQVKEEVDKAKLLQKDQIHELILHWNKIHGSTSDSTLQEHVLEKLRPSSNLQKLSIEGHSGTTCPLWLRTNISIKSLESLCLKGVAWKKFPPIGELWLINVPYEELSANIPEQKFGSLRSLELCELTMVQKWVVHAPCQLFPFLEVLIIKDCPQLVELSFEHTACCQQDIEVNVNLFPRLEKLEITNCPQLLSFPPVPWTEAPCSIYIEGTGSSCLGKLDCKKTYNSGYGLTIEGKNDANDSTLWNVLVFHNLTGLKKLGMDMCQHLPLHYLEMLSTLRSLSMSNLSNVSPFTEADNHIQYQFPVESLDINEWNVSGKELTKLLSYFPKLSNLQLSGCNKVIRLAVNARVQHVTETPGPSSPANKEEQQQGARAEHDVIAASEEAECSLLLLPPQLQELGILNCPELSLLRTNPYDDSNKKDSRTRRGGGLRGLTSLRSLVIARCPKLLSSYSSSSFPSSFPFPNSLEDLEIYEVGTEVLPLSNLTSLRSLEIYSCGDLRGVGLLSLLTQGHLTYLTVKGAPNFFADSEPSQVHEQELPPRSSKLQGLEIDDVARFTAATIHRSLLFSSLTTLEIFMDNKVERFTDQQEALLFVNSLKAIRFYFCNNLSSLPKRLHGLSNLKRLWIESEAIQMLPKDGLPSSLQALFIRKCPRIQSLPKGCLPDSLQTLVIHCCPAIRSLPEVDELPSSLREIDVIESESEELRAHCRKLINIIPIVRV